MAEIIGTPDDDVLYGTTAADLFNGLDGSDTFMIGLNGGLDSFADTGLSGWDSVVAQSSEVSIKLASGFGPASGIEEISSSGHAGVRIDGTLGIDVLDFSATVLTGIEAIGGGPGGDSILGSAGNDRISGHNNSDTLQGGPGDDQLMGGAPNDLNSVEDAEHGADGTDILGGGEGNDELAGGSNNDVLQGGLGDDMLQGGSGADTLMGGLGADSFRYTSTTDGGDLIVDFEQGSDQLDLALIDAQTGSATKNDAFVFGGEMAGVQENSVTFQAQDGVTTAYLDVNADTVADMILTLVGNLTLTAEDFIL